MSKNQYKILEKIFSVINCDIHKVITMLNVRFKIKSKRLFEDKKLKQLNEFDKFTNSMNDMHFTAYFDHSLGGGTETYFFNYLRNLPDNFYLIRIQYFLSNKLYKITIYNKNHNILELCEIDYPLLFKIISRVTCENVVLSNIAGYPQVNGILNLITDYKSKHSITRVILKGHDFYSICPEWNLLNHKNEFCNVECRESECQKCFEKFLLKCKDIENNFSITSWRKMWGEFLLNTVDELEVFSQSSKEIFSKAYPNVNDKIVVNPHKIKPFAKYNICILGHFCICKGSNIIIQLVDYLEKNKIYDYAFYQIGRNYCSIESDLCLCLGEYKRNNLPNILKNNNIDLVLIPSIWPETFSYTTAEAIALGYPVACFDMGGQAEQVKKYSRGKILSSFKPNIIEKELREFLER